MSPSPVRYRAYYRCCVRDRITSTQARLRPRPRPRDRVVASETTPSSRSSTTACTTRGGVNHFGVLPRPETSSSSTRRTQLHSLSVTQWCEYVINHKLLGTRAVLRQPTILSPKCESPDGVPSCPAPSWYTPSYRSGLRLIGYRARRSVIESMPSICPRKETMGAIKGEIASPSPTPVAVEKALVSL